MDRAEWLETEARLLKALEEAKGQYECAKQDVKQALVRSADLGSTHPDGSPSSPWLKSGKFLAFETF